MAIYRGPGGAGDATTDSTSQAIIAVEAAADAEASKVAAAGSATSAANSATSASTSASNAATSATNAASSASAASTSATNAAGSASTATTKASDASTSATNAATSASTATTQATNASNSASAASTSATNASNSASAASTSATSAASSASSALSSKNAAATSETNAASSASAASTSATNAATSATNAANSATSASTSASTATTQATNAANSATAAATSASNAATSATNASNSASTATTQATNASNSASAASTSATNAASSAAAAAASYDDFDDRYLGPKASAPTLDNDGNALQTGALYFNTTVNAMKVYSGSTWLDAYASLSGALLATNNLSDLNNITTARTNLGLGTAALVADNTLVHLAGTETITGAKTFSSTITGSITGNAGTVTNGVYTSGSYADPTWLTSIAGSKVSGNISGNAATATTATNQSGGTVAATTGSFSSSVTLSGGTANGVAYLNGSKVLTTGSALTFDGSKLGVGGAALNNTANIYASQYPYLQFQNSATGTAAGDGFRIGYENTEGVLFQNYENTPMEFYINNAEQMRLTSTGLGIGTSSPSAKLHVYGLYGLFQDGTYNGYIGKGNNVVTGGGAADLGISTSTGSIVFGTGGSFTERMRLDTSGNLGLGVTPSAWRSGAHAFQFGGGAADGALQAWGGETYLTTNAYFNSSNQWTYQTSTNYATSYQQTGGKHAWFTAGLGTAGTAITFTQAMTLDASGNLGLGATSPAGLIDASKYSPGANVAFRFRNTAATSGSTTTIDLSEDAIGRSVWRYNSNTGDTLFGSVDAGAYNLRFYTNATERLRIDSSGNVGIGTSSPSQKLDVRAATGVINLNSTTGTNPVYFQASNNAGYFYFGKDDSTGGTFGTGTAYSSVIYSAGAYPIAFSTNGTERMRITSAGGISFGSSGTAYGSSGQVLTSNGNAAPTWQAVSGTARAWANFNGSDGTIRASYNVSSVTHTGTGSNTINFTNAMANNTYVVVIGGGNYANAPMSSSTQGQSTSSFDIWTGGLSGAFNSAINASYTQIAVFGS